MGTGQPGKLKWRGNNSEAASAMFWMRQMALDWLLIAGAVFLEQLGTLEQIWSGSWRRSNNWWVLFCFGTPAALRWSLEGRSDNLVLCMCIYIYIYIWILQYTGCIMWDCGAGTVALNDGAFISMSIGHLAADQIQTTLIHKIHNALMIMNKTILQAINIIGP